MRRDRSTFNKNLKGFFAKRHGIWIFPDLISNGKSCGAGPHRVDWVARSGVTPSFKAKTECITLCVLGSSFTHKATNSKINSTTSVYYIESYYKILLQDQEV
jgi:hypothetical protein